MEELKTDLIGTRWITTFAAPNPDGNTDVVLVAEITGFQIRWTDWRTEPPTILPYAEVCYTSRMWKNGVEFTTKEFPQPIDRITLLNHWTQME